MKKWISLVTCAACTLSSMTFADEVTAPAVEESAQMAVSPEPADDPATTPDAPMRKQVGAAADDGSKAAGSGVGKYVLAACAIIVAVTALILVSRHSGRHK